MTLYLENIGSTWLAGERSWNSKDGLLYALGVGAGAPDSLEELEFTTENSAGLEQKILPTFAVTLGSGAGELSRFGNFPRISILHAEQALTLRGQIPVSGTCQVRARLVDILDKGEGKGAMIITTAELADKATSKVLAENRTVTFVRGEGGFGGNRGETASWAAPERAPDHVIEYDTRENQSLLYRLSGDRNPLHSDPKSAADVGFERPILHGLCTFGFTGRALLHAACGSDPDAFGGISVRFASPVVPGERLTVKMWEAGRGQVHFQTFVGQRIVLDRGTFTKRKP